MAATFSRQNVNGLNDEEIMKYCPAIFATERHESRSARFATIPTFELLGALRAKGFVPTMAMQSVCRKADKTPYTKHLMRFRHETERGNTRPDVREVVMINAHDGTSQYKFMEGVFRTVCTNGLVTGDIDATYKVKHMGNIIGEAIDATFTILEQAEETMRTIEEMKRIQLNKAQQLLLAEFAMTIRFDLPLQEEEENAAIVVDSLPTTKPVIYQPSDFLRVRRAADRQDDLYTTFNRVQENTIKGGLKRYDNRGKLHTTRGINSITENTKINQALWQFTQKIKETIG